MPPSGRRRSPRSRMTRTRSRRFASWRPATRTSGSGGPQRQRLERAADILPLARAERDEELRRTLLERLVTIASAADGPGRRGAGPGRTRGSTTARDGREELATRHDSHRGAQPRARRQGARQRGAACRTRIDGARGGAASRRSRRAAQRRGQDGSQGRWDHRARARGGRQRRHQRAARHARIGDGAGQEQIGRKEGAGNDAGTGRSRGRQTTGTRNMAATSGEPGRPGRDPGAAVGTRGGESWTPSKPSGPRSQPSRPSSSMRPRSRGSRRAPASRGRRSQSNSGSRPNAAPRMNCARRGAPAVRRSSTGSTACAETTPLDQARTRAGRVGGDRIDRRGSGRRRTCRRRSTRRAPAHGSVIRTGSICTRRMRASRSSPRKPNV